MDHDQNILLLLYARYNFDPNEWDWLGRLDKVLRQIDALQVSILQFEAASAGAFLLFLVLCVGRELGGRDGSIEHVGGGETFAFELLGKVDQVWYFKFVPEVFEFCWSSPAIRSERKGQSESTSMD